jgi:uncharacterized Fe-S cluster-containing radical SAM superfamily protein
MMQKATLEPEERNNLSARMSAPQDTSRGAISGNDAFALSPFIVEWFAGNRPSNQLPISAVCNGHCLFCSNNLNPFPIAGGFFRDIEDIKLQLCSMSANDDPIRLSDSLPGRISEGEALLHPRLFEILELVRRKYFYNTLCFTTNGSMLEQAFLKKLAGFRPIEINVSIHSTRPELWAKIFAKKERDALTAIYAIPMLKQWGMEFAGTIVPLPRLCGWEDLERTYEYLVSSGAKSMILYWPGYTVRTPESVVKDLACPLEEFTAFAERMKGRFSTPLAPLPDMAAPLNVSVETIISKTLKGNPKTRGGAYRHVVWLASRAAFDRLAPLVAEKAASSLNRHDVAAADNLTYQGNIIAAGLLMVDDLIHAGRTTLERWPDADLFLVPTAGFDSLQRDLKGVPAYRMAESLGRPVWLVQNDGVVDAQLSFRVTTRRKPTDIGLKNAMDVYNAAQVGGTRRTWEATPASQRFETLDADHAICIETWPLRDGQGTLNRWTRLVKQESNWRVESVEEGRSD